MAFQISPGINISEIDLTTIVPAVSTTEGGLSGHFRWGPVGKTVLVSSEDSLASSFGKPNSNTFVDFFTGANFLAYTNKLFVVRVVNQSATEADKAKNAISDAANTSVTLIKNDDDYNDNYSSGITGVGSWVARYPGALGNSLKVSTCRSPNAFSSTLTGNIAITSNTSTVTGNNTLFTTEVVVGDILVIGPDKTPIKVSAIGNTTSLTLATRYTGNTVTIAGPGSSSVERRWEYYNLFDRKPGTSPFANTAGAQSDELHVAVVDEDGEWTGVRGTVLEKFEKVSWASDAKTPDGAANYYKEVINQQSQYIWWAAHPAGTTHAGKVASGKVFGGAGTPATVSLTNGRDGATPTNGDYITGWNLFKSAEDIDVSLLPLAAANQTIALHVINNVVEYRQDCVAFMSPRRADVVNNSGYETAEVDDVVAWRNLFPSSSYAHIDSGWKYQYDKYNDVYRWVPCNGDSAGLYAQTDLVRDPWWSAAGFNRGNIKNSIKLAWNPNKAERDLLYKAGINPIVTFPGQGTVLFGDKTMLTTPSAFDRMNVRRLFIVLKKAIGTAAKFTLFEFNDDFTRAQFKNLIEPFLRDIKGRRGVTDFKVVCDETNNTPQVIDSNQFIGSVFVKPNRSINFIQLNFVGVRTGVEFSEVTGSIG